MYNEELNVRVLKKLTAAPLFFFAFGYWMLSNHQLQQTYRDLEPLGRSSDDFNARHNLADIFSAAGIEQSGSAFVLLVLYIIQLFYMFGILVIFKTNIIEQEKEAVALESIDLYKNCLDKDDRRWTKSEELCNRDTYGFKTLFTHSLLEISNSHLTQGMHLEGEHTYNILRNRKYIKRFQYVAVSTPNRSEHIFDADSDDENNHLQSDLVRLALNIAYIDKDNLNAICDKFK